MKVGVLALQGAFIEHIHTLECLGVQVTEVRLPDHLHGLDGLIIPGGESTSIGKTADWYGLLEPLKNFGRSKPMFGTCAGLIFLSKDSGSDQPLLGLMDITVKRNAFGRQKESFETSLTIDGIPGGPFHAIFIRAPIIEAVGPEVIVTSRLEDGRIVAVRQGLMIGAAFHPELTDDTRVHEYFLNIVRGASQNP